MSKKTRRQQALDALDYMERNPPGFASPPSFMCDNCELTFEEDGPDVVVKFGKEQEAITWINPAAALHLIRYLNDWLDGVNS